jgi:hypothetical protein
MLIDMCGRSSCLNHSRSVLGNIRRRRPGKLEKTGLVVVLNAGKYHLPQISEFWGHTGLSPCLGKDMAAPTDTATITRAGQATRGSDDVCGFRS